MYVNLAKYRNFRNIEESEIEFSKGVNILCGGNAEGKTSAVEGIYLCSAGRSHRTVHELELIKKGCDFGQVKLCFTDSRRQRELEMFFLKNGRKSCNVGGMSVRKMSEFVGIFKAVIFCPEHLSIIKDGPSARRSFLDRSISKDDREYMEALQKYSGVLVRRNKLLSDMMLGNMSAADTLDAWDIQLASYGEIISKKRVEYIKKLEEYVFDIFKDMTGGTENPSITYQGGYSAEELLKKLKNQRNREIRNGITLFGVHKDDIDISIGGMSSRIYGSQGQQRSLAIAMKLSEGYISKEKSGEYPVYLLDDILSELDDRRRDYLISGFSTLENERQVIITCCDSSLLGNSVRANKILVKEGKYYKS
ncbi:MAG: DNA replication/repair protein RecF [Ruminococcaceae bacterium]|nr:DNA replication/repair protein RecF [Oscillospiraceae bacterium]